MLLAMARLYALGAATETPDGLDVEMSLKPGLTASKKPRVIPMRTIVALAWAAQVVTIAAALTPSLARAQTYDPRYPVCLQVYGITGNYIACGYTSMDQCRLSAQGRAAQCIVNPYFAGGPKGRGFRRPQ
jgi:hypothetical protein